VIAPSDRGIVSEFAELEGREEPFRLPKELHQPVAARDACGPHDRVYGDMYTLVRFPLKLVWYADGTTALYDLDDDPGESHDHAPEQPAVVRELLEALRAELATARAEERTPGWTPPPELLERLRALGYVAAPAR